MSRLADNDPDLVAAMTEGLKRYYAGTALHSRRVSRRAVLIAEAMNVPDLDLVGLRWAGNMHDLGKLTVSVSTLDKPGPLTTEEWDSVRRHPTVGANMLLDISPRLVGLAAAVRGHHERW